MTNEEIALARADYCFGRFCGNCLFNTYARNKFNTDCGSLTADQIRYILSIIKEDKIMTKKEEIQQEIEKTQKQLAALQEKLKESEDEVPETLDFCENDEFCYVNYAGDIRWVAYTHMSSTDVDCARNHRAFLSEEYAKEFAEKTQFIADMLHFKWLYDRDYEPNWADHNESKWYVCRDGCEYVYDTNYIYRNASVVYFSSEEVAKKCADWLNKKYGYTKE